MSLTYSDQNAIRTDARIDPRTGARTEAVATRAEAAPDFTPVYARGPRKSKGVPTWMILTPIAVLMLGGLGFLAMSGGGEETTLVAEPADAPMIEAPLNPVAPAAPAVALAPVVTSTASPTPVAAPAAAPAARRSTAPATRRAAPAPAARPAARAETTATAAPRVAAPVEPTGPTPYVAPAAPAAATPAPVVVVVPAG